MEVKYSKEFLNLYEKVIGNLKKEKEDVKNSISDIRHSEILLYFLSFISIMAFFMAPINNAKLIFLTVGIFMVIISFIYMIINEMKIYGIKLQFKKKIMKEFASSIEDEFEYKDNDSIPEVYYKKSGFNQTYKTIYSNDYLKGTRDNRKIIIGNISVIKDITKKKQNITMEVFNGIFAYISLLEYENIDEIDLMRVNSKNNKKEKLEIRNGRLYMYAQDILKARKILDDEMIDKISEIRKEFGIDVEFMVNKNEAFFRFFTENTSSTNLFASKNEKQVLYYYYRLIDFISKFANKIEEKSKH